MDTVKQHLERLGGVNRVHVRAAYCLNRPAEMRLASGEDGALNVSCSGDAVAVFYFGHGNGRPAYLVHDDRNGRLWDNKMADRIDIGGGGLPDGKPRPFARLTLVQSG